MRNLYVLNGALILIFNIKITYVNAASLNGTGMKFMETQLETANVDECTPPTIPNGIINIVSENTIRNSLSINVSCENNYILQPSNNNFIYCNKGFWNEEIPPQCKKCVKRSELNNTDSELICPESLTDNSIYTECGQRFDKTHKLFVINGTYSKFAEFPWHVAIYKRDQNDSDPVYHCGGSIINKNSILTAAHCVSQDVNGKLLTTREYYVTAGKYHRNYYSDRETTQKRKVKSINVHPLYKGVLRDFAWDIAVIIVDEPFEISILVHPVCIDWNTQFENEHLSIDKYGEIAGWGKTEKNLNTAALELRVLKVPFINSTQCINFVPNSFERYITHDKFCAGYMNGSSICDGDSGGGLVFEKQEKRQTKYYIRGIVSVGIQKDGVCDSFKYTTYTKVSEHISFIRETIQNNIISTTSSVSPLQPENLQISNKAFVQCKTPNNEEAKCISIYDCKNFITALQSTPTEEEIKYIKDSICGKPEEKKVCCGSTINYLSVIHANPVTSKPIEHRNLNLLPKPGVCGRQTRVRKGRIIGGIVADLYDYPWMALLEYGTPEKSAGFLCTGFLINERYVMTAAHCAVKIRSADSAQVFRVRLGEYNIDTEIDCANAICADPPLNVDIEEIVVHPSYYSRKKLNDVALLRLVKNISYTDFIKPICLPVNGEQSLPGKQVFVAGWGAVKNDGEKSPIKLKTSLFTTSLEDCDNVYKYNSIKIDSSHICIAGEIEKGDCTGDGGGPLMSTLTNSKDIYAEGVLSFGKTCGASIPSVATRVALFMDWILHIIKP